jgi:Ca2+-binding RTX toxin-like protein
VGRLTKVLVFVVVLVVAAAGVAVAANRIGTNQANTLTGTENPDVIVGLGGLDTLNALGGNDEVSGNNGAERMNGGNGDDVMVGGPGGDNINTGNSTDFGSGLEDFVYAFDGNADTVCVGEGDWFVRADEIDTILGPPNCETVIHQLPSTAAANEAGNDGAVTTSSADR